MWYPASLTLVLRTVAGTARCYVLAFATCRPRSHRVSRSIGGVYVRARVKKSFFCKDEGQATFLHIMNPHPIECDVRVTLDTHQSHQRCKIVSTPPSTGGQTLLQSSLQSSVVHFKRHTSTRRKFVSPRAIGANTNASERLSNHQAAV